MKDREMFGGAVIVVGVFVVCLALVWFLRSRVAEQYVVRLADVPRVFEQLQQQGSEGSFAVFMFSDHGNAGEDHQTNLQFSVENGAVGLDWVLIGSMNISDERRVFDFLQARGAKPRRLTKNGVTYLRAEAGDLVQLAQHIMSRLYGVKPEDAVDLVPDGFTWQPSLATH
jgi:hypothetical protein